MLFVTTLVLLALIQYSIVWETTIKNETKLYLEEFLKLLLNSNNSYLFPESQRFGCKNCEETKHFRLRAEKAVIIGQFTSEIFSFENYK